jgi:hypothetical protein
MRTGSADFHQGSSKPNICLQLFCQLSLLGNKKVDAMRCPYKLFRRLVSFTRGIKPTTRYLQHRNHSDYREQVLILQNNLNQ